MNTGPLGAVWDGRSTRFALFSKHATAVDLCLFDRPEGAVPTKRLPMRLAPGSDDGVWRIEIPQAGPGSLYGFRVDGPWEPRHGHRFNPAKLLVDPYAQAVTGEVVWDESLLATNERDNAPFVPRSVVCDTSFDWQADSPPATPWQDTLLYECHVKGMTALHPSVPETLRGTYLGLASSPILDHLLSLGVTAVQLMPVQQFAPERHLAESGRANYWGYSPLALFAPHAPYAGGSLGEQVADFKSMVRSLHRAGLEVILDVVFNHTAEGGQDGTILSMRGIDNSSYYRLRPEDPSRDADFTGCGNTLDASSPMVRRLILDCLRYWVDEMHVDGFRFDLATTLGRGAPDFSTRAPLFEAIAADPTVSRVKLIAEPWDLGRGGRQAGRFPEGWREWNDLFRDGVRRFWRGDPQQTPGRAADLARRLTGSSDLYGRRESEALTGVNYVSCHDGFTLRDLVSYRHKHNLANGEDNRDGRDNNLSSNWGIEGPTADPGIRGLRLRAQKNLLATLALAAGVPMLAHGDEIGRSQNGNNNAYCQDGPLTWVDWALDDERLELLDFTRSVFTLRRRLAMLRRRRFLTPAELKWLGASGDELDESAWSAPSVEQFGMLFAPEASPCDTMLVWFNGSGAETRAPLPNIGCAHLWVRLLSTYANHAAGVDGAPEEETPISLAPYSTSVFACSERPADGSSTDVFDVSSGTPTR